MLVLDRNHDGKINDGSELFGSSTVLSNGQKASDGYTALRELDGNHDGVISSDDEAYGALRVWIDSNSDGVSDESELRTLSSLGIAKINVNATAGTGTDNGNILGLTSSYETTDGVTHDAADVWFLANRTPTTSTATPTATSTVDSAIAALNTTASTAQAAETPPAQDAVSAAVAAQLPPVVATAVTGAGANEATAPVAGTTSALRAQVSNMAQAMGSFVEAGLSQPAATAAPGAAAGDTVAASLSPVALAVNSMADAMKQFDANGNAAGAPNLGVATQTGLKLNTGTNPGTGDILTTGGKT